MNWSKTPVALKFYEMGSNLLQGETGNNANHTLL